MRKLATLLMMVFAFNAKAQQTPSYQHTIDLGVGLWISGPTVPGVIDHRSYDEIRHKGPIPSVTYQYMMNRHWGLGATASLLYYNKKMVYDDTGETIDKMSETALALMFTTRYYWRTKNWVRVYSSASVGFGYDWEKNYKIWKGNDSQKVIFCGQISPLGIEVGKYRLIGFGEIGLGMTGWCRAGIGYRF